MRQRRFWTWQSSLVISGLILVTATITPATTIKDDYVASAIEQEYLFDRAVPSTTSTWQA